MSFPWLAKTASFAAGLAIVSGAVVSGVPDVTTRPSVIEHVTNASADGEIVVAIGDSIMEGHGLDASEAWPALLAEAYGWRLTSLASDGSGFVTVGNDGDTFADQAEVAIRLHPSVVIVSGSSNDLGESDASIALHTDSTMMALRAALPKAEILAVSPIWNDSAEPAQLTLIGRDVAQAAGLVGARELDIGQPLYDRSDLMQFGDVHPTAAGQRVIAAAVEKALGG